MKKKKRNKHINHQISKLGKEKEIQKYRTNELWAKKNSK